MKPLRVGIIGLGVGEKHMEGYLRHPLCRVEALCDFSREKMALAQAKCGHARLCAHPREILSDPEIDLVSIASYDDAHFEQTLAALNNGKHVFVEKPLCRSLEELKAIKAAMLANPHLRMSSNLVLRAAPVYNWLRSLISEGALGEIYAFDGDYLYGRLHKITQGWRKDVDDYSVMQGGGIHIVDLMIWLTGQAPVTVSAAGNSICSIGTDFRFHDFVSASYEFSSGMVARITANFGCVHSHQHVVRVFGTKGTFIYDDQGPRVHTSRDPSVAAAKVDLPALPATKGDLIPGFVQSVANGDGSICSTQQEFDVISACIAADLAERKKQSVEIEYV